MSNADGHDDSPDLTVIGNSLQGDPAGTNLGSREFPVDPMIGRSLDGGKYKIVGVLGRGGMSIVYKAQQELVGRFVAIKTLTVQLLGDQTIVKRFTREVQALGKLNHPNIVTAFDCVLDGQGQPYFIMDYLEGMSLAEVLDEVHHIDQARAQRIAMQVCDAVGCAHNNHIVHRDLKPANIMLVNPTTDEEQVKIVDFGVAKISEDVHKLTATGELWGTPSYMSPEQAHGHYNDFRSDIYSVGCVIFEALTGTPPFEGQSPIETLMNHINSPIPSMAAAFPELNIHPTFDLIVQKALQKDPNNRFQSMKEMETALRELNLSAPPTVPLGSWSSALAPQFGEPSVVANQPGQSLIAEHKSTKQLSQADSETEQLHMCPVCGKQKRSEKLGSITSWLRLESTCLCESQPGTAERHADPQTIQQNAPTQTPPPAPQPVAPANPQPAPPVSNSARGTTPGAANLPYHRPGVKLNGVSTSAKAGMALCGIAALVLGAGAFIVFKPSSPVSQSVPPVVVPPSHNNLPANTNSSSTSNGASTQQSSSESNQVQQDTTPTHRHAYSDYSDTTTGQASNPSPDNQTAVPNTETGDTASSEQGHKEAVHKPAQPPVHHVKKVKKHSTTHSGATQQVRPIDDFDRWNQFNSGH